MKAAKQRNCESIEQECTKLTGLNNQRYIFQYHCLVNSWGNATIEVCALNRSIFGNNIFFNISNTNKTDAFLRRFLNNYTKTDSPFGFRNIYNSF